MTNQKDQDRLHLLKEVAGTKLYEERRAESTKIMDETSASFCISPLSIEAVHLYSSLFRGEDLKREKIDDLLKFITARLDELEEEKEELKEFQVRTF